MPVLVLPLLLQLIPPDRGGYTGGGPAKGAVMIVVLIGVYFLPTMLAFRRERRRKWRIMAINVLLGWTIIGWVVSMLLTYAYEPPPEGEEELDTPRVPGSPRH